MQLTLQLVVKHKYAGAKWKHCRFHWRVACPYHAGTRSAVGEHLLELGLAHMAPLFELLYYIICLYLLCGCERHVFNDTLAVIVPIQFTVSL